jgi:anti-sigma B factor antagonist
LSNDRASPDARGVPGSLVGVVHVIDGRRADDEAAIHRPGAAAGTSRDGRRRSSASPGKVGTAAPGGVVTAQVTRDAEHIEVRCDRCGFRVDGIGGSMRHWDAVWALVAGTGWVGSSRVEGPHACPDCAGPGAGRVEDPAPMRVHAALPWRAEIHLLSCATIVELRGDLDVSVRDAFRDVLDRARDISRNVVLDLAGVPLIDSTGLGLLVRAHQRARHRGGWVCLVAPSRFIVAVLHTMRLESVFPIFEDCGRAVEWLARRPQTVYAGD